MPNTEEHLQFIEYVMAKIKIISTYQLEFSRPDQFTAIFWSVPRERTNERFSGFTSKKAGLDIAHFIQLNRSALTDNRLKWRTSKILQ